MMGEDPRIRPAMDRMFKRFIDAGFPKDWARNKVQELAYQYDLKQRSNTLIRRKP